MMPGFRATVRAPLIGVSTSADARRQRRVPTAREPSRGVQPEAAGHRDAVRRAHVDAAADLVADLERALRCFVLLGPAHRAVERRRRPRTRATRSPSSAAAITPLRLVLGRHRQCPAVGRLRGRRRRRLDELDRRLLWRRRTVRRRRVAPAVRGQRAAASTTTGSAVRIGRRHRRLRTADATTQATNNETQRNITGTYIAREADRRPKSDDSVYCQASVTSPSSLSAASSG